MRTVGSQPLRFAKLGWAFITAALIPLAGSPAKARAEQPYRVNILAAGIFELGPTVGQEAAPNAVMGHLKRPESSRLIEATTTICARLGRSFGVDYEVVGGRAGTDAALNSVTVFPHEGLTAPDGKHFKTSRFDVTVPIGSKANRSYSFDEAWEMVDGEWVFEFHANGRLIGQQRFTVTTRCEIS